MFSLSHNNKLGVLVASGLIVLNTFASPVQADEFLEHLGPVGPHQPIVTTVGSKRVLAFYIPGRDTCALHAIVWTADEDTTSPARIRISMEPGAIVHIDSPENKSLNLKCSDDTKTLAVVEDEERVAFGIAAQEPMQPVRAAASRF